MSEERVLVALGRGDRAAFNELVGEYQASVYTTAYHILADSQLAEQATVAVFSLTFRAAHNLEGMPIRLWLLQIEAKVLGDMCKRRRTKFSALAIAWRRPTPLNGDRSDSAALLAGALSSLPFDHRITVVLADIEGLDLQDICLITGEKIATVEKRLDAGRAQVRDLLFPPRASKAPQGEMYV